MRLRTYDIGHCAARRLFDSYNAERIGCESETTPDQGRHPASGHGTSGLQRGLQPFIPTFLAAEELICSACKGTGRLLSSTSAIPRAAVFSACACPRGRGVTTTRLPSNIERRGIDCEGHSDAWNERRHGANDLAPGHSTWQSVNSHVYKRFSTLSEATPDS